MYSVSLSSQQVQVYVKQLDDTRMLIFDEKTGQYRLTTLGLRMLGLTEKLVEMVKSPDDTTEEMIAALQCASKAAYHTVKKY